VQFGTQFALAGVYNREVSQRPPDHTQFVGWFIYDHSKQNTTHLAKLSVSHRDQT